MEVAAESARPIGVIAESPYRLPATPARNVLAVRGLPYRAVLPPAMWALNVLFGGGLASRQFDRAGWAQRTACPLLVLHGVEDEVCPVQDGRDVAAAVPRGQMVEIAGGHHNDLWTDPALAARCAEAMRAFVRGLVQDPPRSVGLPMGP